MKITRADFSIAVMSGHFLQRGEPAMVDKWTRARMAVACGVDVVIEIPSIYACASAEHFARGSIGLLSQLGCVTDLVFGSESGNLDALQHIGRMLADESSQYRQVLRRYLSLGLPFAAAQEKTVIHILEQQSHKKTDHIVSVFKQPNNLLGIVYLKEMIRVNSNITPHTIKRVGAGYHDTSLNNRISSATGIRKTIKDSGETAPSQPYMPPHAYEVLRSGIQQFGGPVDLSQFNDPIMTLLKRASKKDILQLPHISEGLENRIYQAAHQASNIFQFMDLVKNKRVPYTRLQRMLVHLLLNINQDISQHWHQHALPPYAKILAFSENGRLLIKHCTQLSGIPLINKPALYKPQDLETKKLFDLDCRAGRIYGSVMKHHTLRSGNPDLQISPWYSRDIPTT